MGTTSTPVTGSGLAPTHQVALQRHDFPATADQLLWEVIKDRTAALSFSRYEAFINAVMFDVDPNDSIGIGLAQGRWQNARSPVWGPSSNAPQYIDQLQQTLQDPNAGPEERHVAQQELAQHRLEADEQYAAQREFPVGASPTTSGVTPPSTPKPGEFAAPLDGAKVQQLVPAGELAGLRQKLRDFGVFNSDAYQLLKAATELFVLHEAGRLEDVALTRPPSSYLSQNFVNEFRQRYLHSLATDSQPVYVLPYLDRIRRRLADLPIKQGLALGIAPESYGILRSRIGSPVLVELLWNYWHEQAFLVQTMNLITLRFQNVRRGPGPDPLANFELDALRPLSNLLWGYVQDEINRLGVGRRAYEYAHGLGLQLVGKAVPRMNPADVRSQFLPAFHDLLRLAWIFFREDDDNTITADAFPMLNALRELHFVIAEGAHNQFGDLPMRARIEMLTQQWLLARSEMRDFLRGRIAVPYPEEWMDRVDAMKALIGWNDASVINYNDLAVFGEQILLSVRYGDWSTTTDQSQAANWARSWRPAIQRYTHALKIVSGIDLSIGDVIEVRTQSERLRQGVVAGRAPAVAGNLVQAPPPPTARAVGPRPGSDLLLRPSAAPAPAAPARRRTEGPSR